MADYYPSNDDYSVSSGNTSGANVAEKLLGSRDSATTRTFADVASSSVLEYMFIGPRPISAVNFFSVHRAHMIFDLSGVSGTIESATLKVYAYSADTDSTLNNGHKFYVVGYDYGGAFNEFADALPTNNTTGDWTSSSVPTYSSEITVDGVSVGDEISVTLNSTAITAINSAVGSGDFDIGLVGNDDYKGDFTISSYADGFGNNGVAIYTRHASTVAYRPVLSLTVGEAIVPIRMSVKSGQVTLKSGNLIIK